MRWQFSRMTARLILPLAVISLGTAQFKNYPLVAPPAESAHYHSPKPEGVPKDPPHAVSYWIAAAEVIGSDAVSWAYFRFVRGDHWARIDIHSIKRNLKNGFWWDEDGFMGNQFNHPYHGSSYFNAARVNGLGFWESTPYALAGSALWEFFLETEPPSTNDIVNTPVSGIILGEISYRITDLILDDSKRGLERILRESSSFILNPVRGFNRLIRGELWRAGTVSTRPDHAIWLSGGGNNVFQNRMLKKNRGYVFAGFDMEYGDRFAVEKHVDPFDHFSVHAEFSASKEDNIIGILASGLLTDGTVSVLGENESHLGLYKEFHLFHNLVYHLTTTSVAGRLSHVAAVSSASTLLSSLSISAILMGGVNSQHAELSGKKYNIGPGACGTLKLLLNLENYGDVHWNYERFWLHTLNGAKSEEFIGIMNFGTNCRLNHTIMLGLDFLFYDRQGDYRNLPMIKDANSAARLCVKFEMS